MVHRFASLRQLSVLLLLILKAAAPLDSFAQQPAGAAGSLQLTLKQAVQLALKQNPQRVIAQLLMYESDRNSQIARSALLPHADIEANGSLNQYNVQSIARTAKPTFAGPFQVIEAGPTFRKPSWICRRFAHTRSAAKERTRRAPTNRPPAKSW